MDLKALCQNVALLSHEVREFIMGEVKKFDRKHVEYKGLNNMVSYVDKEAERRIVEKLATLLPGSGFVAEEGSGAKNHTGYNWVVDPLDGTTNFIHAIPIFSISIALMHNDELLIGVVHELNQNECFYAWKGGGAFLNGEPIHVSNVKKLAQSLVATGFPYHDFGKMPQYMEILNDFMRKSHGIRRIGSAAVDLAYVASGRFEVFFEYNLNPWDVAAGCLLVEEAGGKVTDFNGGRNFVFGRELISASSNVHQEAYDIIHSLFYS